MEQQYFMRQSALILCLVCGLHSAGAFAEVFRWVDSNGKVHYSDKRPKENAEDITADVSKQNIDTSIDEQRKVQLIFRPENDADRAYQQRQQQTGPSAEHIKYCNKQRQYLHDVSGPVQFLDKEGKPMKVTERERQAEEERMKKLLAERCSDV